MSGEEIEVYVADSAPDAATVQRYHTEKWCPALAACQSYSPVPISDVPEGYEKCQRIECQTDVEPNTVTCPNCGAQTAALAKHIRSSCSGGDTED